MNATTVAVDLAKKVFELAVADGNWRVIERARLTRSQFERWFANRKVDLVVMEACGSAHHWGRWLRERGIAVRLLPAQYVRAYVKRNKTDAADALALLEAARASDIKPVAVKSIEQQALQALHRLRSGWMATRTRRINTLRGFCREFGLEVAVGAVRGLAQIARLLADERSAIPALLRTPMRLALEEIRLMEARIEQLERELAEIARRSPACEALVSVPGIGLLTSTAMVAAVGDPKSFDSGRRYSSFLGLTPREFSSGNSRHLGRISKRGEALKSLYDR
jgi:transposase